MTLNFLNKDYSQFLGELKQRIRSAQLQAARSVNQELIKLYWDIGKQILERQKTAKWGSKLLERLSLDLQHAFPGMKGFSIRNLKYMRQFAELYSEPSIGQQPAAQLPWAHIMVLMNRIKSQIQRNWYVNKAIEFGWSRSVLEMQIDQELYQRQGPLTIKTTNFKNNLPPLQSDLAEQMLKNPYNFDFLTIADEAQEREIEKELTKHITKFLLELGAGFAFIGNQVPITVGSQEFHLDMLFYHLKLRCYVVIELKANEFKPADTGQLNFYLSAVDAHLKQTDDNPTIGILLCRSHDKVVADYALRKISSPIGVSEYQLTKAMPKELKINLPTIEEIENELNKKESELI